jgi:hypothetical protein
MDVESGAVFPILHYSLRYMHRAGIVRSNIQQEQSKLVIPQHIASAADLVTPHEEVRKGFLEQALAKTEKAQPYLDEAEHFKGALERAQSIEHLLGIPAIRPQLVGAAGFSSKAQTHLSEQELLDSLRRVLDLIAAKASDDWREETLYRYLLTKGDALGGSMRNYTGALAAERFTDAIEVALEEIGQTPSIRRTSKEKIRAIRWENRLLVFDRKPKSIGKNIDAILIDASIDRGKETEKIKHPEDFLACGELKGGIDPAGADEHWKTANSALDRIRTALQPKPPALFFLGAAIANSMAEEIYRQLQDGRLTHAANFTSSKQLADLVSWLVQL